MDAVLAGSRPEVTFAPAQSTAAAPPFSLALLDGTRVQAAATWRTRPVVAFFFASWCSRCATQQQALEPVADADHDVVDFVGVAGQDKPGVEGLGGDARRGYPVGIDAGLETWRRYAVRTHPPSS